MPEYEFIGDDATDFPGLGFSAKPGETVTLATAVDHPLLKEVTKAKAPAKAKTEAAAPEGAKK